MLLKLQDSAELLAQSNRETAWREMAKQVAHEIKNPLTPMKLSIQYLQRAIGEAQQPAEAAALVGRVANTLIEQIDALSEIATEFANFAKMPVGDLSERVSINQLLVSAHALFADNPQLNISLEMPTEERFVRADKNQLLRVFNNLLKNAEQAISCEQKGEIAIQLETTDQFAFIRISDNGIGISDVQVPSIFLPNFTTKTSGSGLGLAMSKSIVEQVGGTINFTSEEGVGTCFCVLLPLLSD